MFLIISILLLACSLTNDAIAVDLPLRSSFNLQVSTVPRPVVIDGRQMLVYELHLTNFAQSALMLKCVSVLETSTEKQIMNVCDDLLTARLALTGSDKRTIHPGMHAVVYLEVEIAERQIPPSLKHRIDYEDPENHAPGVVEGAQISLDKDPPLILDPPLAGGPWAAIYGASWERGHRRVFYAVDGHACLPGRFAIDWIQLDEQGRFAKNDNDHAKNWYGFGTEVLAVADARVAATRDNVKDSETVSAHPRNKLEDAAGNYIALDLGNGYFAFYEHLKLGSIRAKTGDLVRSGQVIASLGFTGDSTGPHLHFHVADRNSLLGAEGVPYHFKSFSVIGSYNTLDEFGKKRWNSIDDSAESQRSSEFPSSNVVVMFNPSSD